MCRAGDNTHLMNAAHGITAGEDRGVSVSPRTDVSEFTQRRAPPDSMNSTS